MAVRLLSIATLLLLVLPGTIATHYRVVPATPLAVSSIVGSPLVGSPPAPLLASGIFPATATLGLSVGTHYGSPFYAVVFTDAGLGPVAATDLGLYFNSTPFSWFRLSGGGAAYDPSTQINWVPPASGVGAYVPQSGELINLTWFKAWCNSRTPHCNWIVALPAEQNDTTAAVNIAKYYHNTLHFAPTAWEMGNEPNAWTHFGIAPAKWSTTDASTPTGIGYATMVNDYIKAISKLFPSDRFIGIQSNCACGASLVSSTAKMDGAKIMGMAYHSYPWANASSTKTSQFMGALLSPTRNLSYTADRMRTLDTSLCPKCANIPIQVGEYNAGPVPVHSPLAMTYSGAPFLAASIIQALQANVSMFTIYSLGWLYNSTTGGLLPQGILYQEILKNMTMGTDFLVNVNVTGVGGVYAMLIQNGTRQSLLIVNTNNTRGISLALTSALFPILHSGTTWSWDPRSKLPRVHSYLLIPPTFRIWSQGILLIDNF